VYSIKASTERDYRECFLLTPKKRTPGDPREESATYQKADVEKTRPTLVALRQARRRRSNQIPPYASKILCLRRPSVRMPAGLASTPPEDGRDDDVKADERSSVDHVGTAIDRHYRDHEN